MISDKIKLMVWLFMTGCCIGSFMNVVIYRVPQKLLLGGRSFCPGCYQLIHWYDNIPIVSFMILKGKCRACGCSIPGSYLLTELWMGVAAVCIYLRFGLNKEMAMVLITTAVLNGIAVIDAKTMKIPNCMVIALLVVAAGSFLIDPGLLRTGRVYGCFAVSLPMYLMNVVIPGSFGGGDIKMMAACGLLLGVSGTILAGFISILAAGGYAVYLLSLGKIKREEHLAFGPFLAAGVWISMMYGKPMIIWYQQFYN